MTQISSFSKSHSHIPSLAESAARLNLFSLISNSRVRRAARAMSLLNSYPIAATIAVYVKPRKNGTSIIPQITNGTCHARIAAKDHAAADQQGASLISAAPHR